MHPLAPFIRQASLRFERMFQRDIERHIHLNCWQTAFITVLYAMKLVMNNCVRNEQVSWT